MAEKFIQKATARMKAKGTLGKFGKATDKKIATAKREGGIRAKEAIFAENMKHIAHKHKMEGSKHMSEHKGEGRKREHKMGGDHREREGKGERELKKHDGKHEAHEAIGSHDGHMLKIGKAKR